MSKSESIIESNIESKSSKSIIKLKNESKNHRRFVLNIIAILSLVVSIIGLSYPEIYGKVMSDLVMPGVLSQDMVAAAVSIVLLILNNYKKTNSIKIELFNVGIIWFLFYAYGIYVIERAYNSLYLVYMAIFALSFYSSIEYFIKSAQRNITEVKLSPVIMWICVIFALFIPMLFYPMWISQLLVLMQTGEKIEFLYSVYIIDLCFVLPSYFVFAIKAIRKQMRGILAIPFLLVFGFLLLLPVGFGELFRPLYGDPINYSDMFFFAILSSIFLILAVLYLKSLKIPKELNSVS